MTHKRTKSKRSKRTVAKVAVPAALPRESVGQGRFVLDRQLGPSGATFLARDRSGQPVVIKLAQRPDDPDLADLICQEFLIASELQHPNLERVLTAGREDDGTPWFAAEYLAGESLAAAAVLPGAELLEVAAQMGRALHHLHTRGMVHGDVTPANIVRVPLSDRKAGSAHRNTLVDLGFARSESEELESAVRGTWGWIAPEVLCGGAATRASDLYALGVTLYVLATGGRPFDATTPHDMLAAQRAGVPAEFSIAFPDVPLALEAIMRRLLDPRIDRRYPDANAVIRELNAYAGTDFDEEPAPAALPFLARPPLLGRDADLRELLAAAECEPTPHRSPAPITVIVHGAPGAGRSRLLEELQARIDLAGVATVAVRASPEDPRPLGAVGDLLVRAVDRFQPGTDFLRTHGAVLARQALGSALPTSGHPPATSDAITAEQLATALLALAADRPLVLMLDDAQSLSLSQRGLLAHVHRAAHVAREPAGDAAPRLRIVLGWRATQPRPTELEPVLAELGAGAATHELAPLESEPAAALARWTLGGAAPPDDLHGPLGLGAARTPRELLARARSLFEQGAVVRTPQGEILSTAALTDWTPPRDAGDLAAKEVEGLGRTARQLLTALAVFVRPVPAGVPLKLVQSGRATALQALAELQARGIVRRLTIDGRARVSLAHSGDRRALLRGYARDARRRLARRALTALDESPESHTTEFLEERARLTAESGAATAALDRALEVAAWSAATGKLRTGADTLQRALELATRPSRRRREAELALFDLELKLGEFERARHRLDRVGDDATAAMLLRLIRLMTAQGRYPDAAAACTRALRSAADDAPLINAALLERRAFAELRSGESEAARRDVAQSRALIATDSSPDAETLRCALDLLEAGLELDRGDHAASIRTLRRAEASAQRRDHAEQRLLALGNLGVVLGQLNHVADSLEVKRRAAALCDATELLAHRPRALNSLGVALLRAGRLDEAVEVLLQALGLARRLGEAASEQNARHNYALALRDQGRLSEALQHFELSAGASGAVGETHVAIGSWLQVAEIRALLGRDAQAARAMQEAQSLTATPAGAGRAYEVDRSRGLLALRAGDSRAAAALLTRAAQHAAARGDHPTRAKAEAEAALALVGIGEALPPQRWPPPPEATAPARVRVQVHVARAAAALRQDDAEQAATELAFAATALPTSAGDPLAVSVDYWSGRLAEHTGDWREAFGRYQRAWDGWLAMARHAPESSEQRLLGASEPVEVRDRLDRARRELRASEQGALAGDLSADDLTRLAELTRALGTERRVKPLLERILDTAIALTGAERGFVILAAGDAGDSLGILAARNMDGEQLSTPERKISRSVASQAMRERRLILASDAQRDPRFQSFVSVHRLQLRSLLCAPLTADDVPQGCVYLDHRFTPDAFDARARALIEAFAAHAGLALQTARLMDEREAALEEAADLRSRLEEALAVRTAQLRVATATAGAPLHDRESFEGIVGRSKPMQEVFRLIDKFAATDMPVLILGESGTGKELVARALHRRSRRADGPLVSENLGALSPTIAASELFGHVAGAFTGALRERRGLFELAKGGTLFLDEIGDLDAEIQVALLRVLEEQQVRPVGGEHSIDVDVRVICATHHDLRLAVQAGSFREDLFYRINVLTLELPPLRDRLADLPLLVQHFRDTIAHERGRCPPLAPETLRVFADHRWPGNVRELENELRRAAVLAGDGPIRPAHCAAAVRGHDAPAGRDPLLDDARARGFWDVIADTEARIIREALAAAGGNQSEAARQLQLDRVVLIRKMREYGLRESVTAPSRGRPRRKR